MDSMLKNNGNIDKTVGFRKGKVGHPDKNPYEMENPYGGKEDISWLLD